ncbi:hypothetical protein MHIR_DE00035 [Candidatus Doolittlea endobia]|uniref:Uncharacterized protein n=1 Tax=Candidatus Doolittlea endobia TaxID=1778262 RepID=A0A143WU63_9ENTR|nr:hypothetical protein MHIR_DE00035 [Candidatus Doolittlea endobia]
MTTTLIIMAAIKLTSVYPKVIITLTYIISSIVAGQAISGTREDDDGLTLTTCKLFLRCFFISKGENI